jgi:hypothetical protein
MLFTPTFAQDCCQPAYQSVGKTVYEYEPVTTYRLEYETVFEEKEITVQRPVWETEVRERRYTVAKPVLETSEREERYTVMRPVWETSDRDCSYDRVRYVTETEMREQRYVVSRPVWEETFREQRRVVRRPVAETAMQDYSYTRYEPVTTMRTDYVDQGGYVSNWVYQPGNVRNRLQSLPGGYVVDPLTGRAYWRRGGFHWVPTQGPGSYTLQQQYKPNVVAVQRPQTTYTPRTVVEKRPVQVTRYVDEVLTEKIPVRVCRMERTEEVRQVPVTVQKPVVERVNYKIPVRTCRWVQQEMVRKIPVTTQRIVHEERVDQVPVRVCKMVTEVRKVQEPRTVAAWKPYQTMRCVPRTVVMRVPVDPCQSYALPGTTTYYHSAPSVTIESPAVTTTQKVPTEAEGDDGTESVMKKGAGETAEEGEAGEETANGEPKDTDPTGQPALDAKDLQMNAPAPPEETEDTERPKPEKSA